MDKRTVGISVYPDYGDAALMRRIYDYIDQARACGYDEVFTSLHMPESQADDVSGFVALAAHVHQQGMIFSVDLSGPVASRIVTDDGLRAVINAAAVDWYRLDCDFTSDIVVCFAQAVHATGLMINASTTDGKTLTALVHQLNARLPGIRLRGHHNFYPLPTSGLDMSFMMMRTAPFTALGIPVTACVASLTEPRQPLFAGLPTLESARYLPAGQAAAQLFAVEGIVSVLIGDAFAREDELKAVAKTAVGQDDAVTLRVLPARQASAQERSLMFGMRHQARPDAACAALRSLSSRGMAAKGRPIEPSLPQPLRRGDVVVGNINAKRYSGELAVLTGDLPASDLFNHAGRLVAADLWKLEMIQPGGWFVLQEIQPARIATAAAAEVTISACQPDEHAWLEELWNQTLTADPISAAIIQEHVFDDPNHDDGWLLYARAEGRPVGFIYGLVRKVPYHERGLEPGKGWIFGLGVLPAYRRQGIGHKLMTAMMGLFRKAHVTTVVAGMYSPHYILPGLDVHGYPQAEGLLGDYGFTLGQPHYSMYRTLFGYTIPDDVRQAKRQAEADGYRFMACPAAKADDLAAFIQANFTAGWYTHAQNLRRQGTLGEMTVVCLDRTGAIVGYAQRGMGGNPLRFGPIGVAAGQRGRQLGSVLLDEMLYDMCCRGLYLAFFMTTDDKARPFYVRHGFAVSRVFHECSAAL